MKEPDIHIPMPSVGRYELLAPLGSGGMAQVFRAVLAGPGQATKPVALKLIQPHLSLDHHFVLMFLDELRIAMALTHRNIVQTFDGGEFEGHYYLVMELVVGCSLAQLMHRHGKRKGLPTDIAISIAMEVCAALDYAHQFKPEQVSEPAGVLHRDISPSNILLSNQGDVKLADFGVAKATGRLVVSSANLVKGKLSYMAPEQARGEACPQSDLFSLGAVLYQMLSGRSIRTHVTLEDVRQGGLRTPSLVELRPDLPPSLIDCVMCCLAPKPLQRPPSAEALRQSLNEEYHRLPSAQSSTNIHGRLRTFLEQVLEQPAPQAGQYAHRVAAVLLEQAREIPTDNQALSPARVATEVVDEAPAPPAGASPALSPGGPAGPPGTRIDPYGTFATAGEFSTEESDRGGSTPAQVSVRPPHTLVTEEAETQIGEPSQTAITTAHSSQPIVSAETKEVETLIRESSRSAPSVPPSSVASGAVAHHGALRPGPLESTPLSSVLQPATTTAGKSYRFFLVAGLAFLVTLVVIWPIFSWLRQGSPAPAVIATADQARKHDLVLADAGPASRPRRDVIVSFRAADSSSRQGAPGAGAHREPPRDLDRPPLPPRFSTDAPKTPRGGRKIRSGRLELNSSPWSKVYVDGKYRGVTPLQRFPLPAGPHEVKLVNPDQGLSVRFRVTIRPGRTLKQVIDLRQPH